MKDFDEIKKAVLKHHGGFQNASKSEIMRIWNSLDETTQKRYLKKEKINVDSRSKHDIQSGT